MIAGELVPNRRQEKKIFFASVALGAEKSKYSKMKEKNLKEEPSSLWMDMSTQRNQEYWSLSDMDSLQESDGLTCEH